MTAAYKGKPYVLAIDPGLKSGTSLWSPTEFAAGDAPHVTELAFVPMCDLVAESCSTFGRDLALVVESFTITVQTAKKTQAPWSLEGIGVCRYFAAKFGCELVIQAPSSAKLFSSDQRLRDLGWWSPGKGHGNDATRHLLLYAATKGWWSEAIAL